MLNSKQLKPVKRFIKTALGRQSKLDRYLAASNKKALKIVSKLENQNSLKLSFRQRKMADDYAADVFGDKIFAPWLYVCTLIRGDFVEGWIPENYFSIFVAPQKGLPLVSIYKTFSSAVLKTEFLPDIAYYRDGIYYEKDYNPVSFSDFINNIHGNYSSVFIKADCSNQGRDVKKISVKNLTADTFTQFGNCVIQAPIKPHPFFEEIGTVSSIRILTVRNLGGEIEFRASCLNLGRTDDEWTHGGESILVAILGINGELDSIGYTSEWKRCIGHPDTGFVFEKKRIPRFNDAVEACVKLHSSIPHFRIIAWDVLINHDGQVRLMEWNAVYPGIKFHEGTVGPCFKGLGWEHLWKNK